jgi:hypothetical protein
MTPEKSIIYEWIDRAKGMDEEAWYFPIIRGELQGTHQDA